MFLYIIIILIILLILILLLCILNFVVSVLITDFIHLRLLESRSVRLLRVSCNCLLDHLQLVSQTIEQFGPST